MSNPVWLLDRLSFLLAASGHDKYYDGATDGCGMCLSMDGDFVDFTDMHELTAAVEEAADQLLDHISAGGKLPASWTRPSYDDCDG
ncbi:hypothetical protein [Lentzea sp. CA-135723]|uniref:hypothetical protein n=1 Tax=Lentzea sp. CA-135723 TaxID=3239950 RepID=UPI003D8EAA37